MMTGKLMAAVMTASMLAACGGDADTDLADDMSNDSGPVTQPSDTAGAGANGGRATLRDLQGQEVGSATLTRGASGMVLQVSLNGLPAGEHGIHVHMVGQCDAASAFESAGDHLNPTGAQHGLENDAGPHMGDLPNVTLAGDGSGQLDHTSTLVDTNVFDADGSALVVHAARDDQRTDPSGNSGGRIACGVIERGQG